MFIAGHKKVPFKRQLKWNKPERADKNKPSTHSYGNDSVTFLFARDKWFRRFACEKSCTRRCFAWILHQRKAVVAFLLRILRSKMEDAYMLDNMAKKHFVFI